ncbi:MAG: hypothetical protein J1F20_03575 [Muribaculaceae bacterium]|nr:hypothetical protein [Muribaculaceae bacterium]
MRQNLILTLALGSALVLTTACSKKLGQFSQDYFSTNPNPLEVVGEKVPATVTAKVPAKFFVKNATVTVTPTLVYDGTESTSQSYTFQGENVKGNAPVVSYDNGGTFNIPVNFNYTPAMDQSVLYLDFAVTQGKKQYVLPRVPVATGVISTAALATAATVTPAASADAFQRIINEKYAADIMFLINVANIRANQLNTDAMVELQEALISANDADNRQIEEINIKSYASPDGPWDFNNQLAQKRENNTIAYMTSELTRDNITEFGELTANFTPEDWEGFQELVSKSNIQDKELILSILKMYKDPAKRNEEIKNLGSVFTELAETILPKLRYSRITASINVIGKSDAELLELVTVAPEQLSIEELLYTGTLTNDNALRQAIYSAATRQYPNDYRAWNNLGMTQYVAGDYKAAKNSFSKASSLAKGNPEPLMNLGLIEMIDGNYNEANRYFGSAAGTENLGEALGVYYLKQGDNTKAAQAFGNTKSNNAALAQILTKDYAKAQSTLAGINNPDATTYYLMAVLGARTNNEAMINSNLKQAVKLDNSLAAKAAKDLEFANYNISSALN